MRMLAAHPAVVAYDRPPYEARGGKYWLHVLKTLAAPADASKRVGAPMEFHLEPLAAGGNPFYSAAFAAWPAVEAWSGSTYVTDLAAFCQRSIDGWYLATAAAQDQASAPLVYFAEKHFPDVYPRLLRELYPAARELFLVRDFRDMVASMQAYNARKGFGDFGRETAESDASLAGRAAPGSRRPARRLAGTRRGNEPGPLRRPGARPGGGAAPAAELARVGRRAGDGEPPHRRGRTGCPGTARPRHGRLASGVDRTVAKRSVTRAAGGRRGDVWRPAPGVRLRVARMIGTWDVAGHWLLESWSGSGRERATHLQASSLQMSAATALQSA